MAVAAPDRILVADIAFDPRVGGGVGLLTYLLEEPAEPGEALLVPLGGRPAVGFIAQVRETSPLDLGFSSTQLRSAIGKIAGLSLPSPVMNLLQFVSAEYLCPIQSALGAAIPPGAQERLAGRWRLHEDRLAAHPFPPDGKQKDVLKALRDAGGELVVGRGRRLHQATQNALKALRAKGVVTHTLELALPSEGRESPELLRLTPDEAKVEAFLSKQAKRKPAQALALLRLQELDRPVLTAADIKSLCGVTDSALKALLSVGLLEELEEEHDKLLPPPKPNRHQVLAIESILDPLLEQAFREFLLFGVTGSGKTEVYLRVASEALKMGRQVLYLVPEIALASQAVSYLRERFGRRVAVLHSELSVKDRLDNWSAIRSGDAAVVIGARSALFAPLSNIGLIVMDEEHETSYKQESTPRYHAKTMARFLAREHGCPLVLGSATPSVESYFEAESEVITLLSLPERAASARLPEVVIEDLREGYRLGQPALFSERLIEELEQTLEAGKQAILFLNRRAYAPFLICRDCGYAFKCPLCAVSLALSRKLGLLRCHHCGHQQRPPDTCPACSGSRIKPFGVGTEKVEEAVTQHFPGAKVARLDRDVAQRRGALEKVLADFASGETQVLVGTQMVAKGLNFPNVTLVGVIAADVSLNLPDFRASERTLQLLSQVAGRAGRGKSPGRVIIQTLNPDHWAVVCAESHDYVRFYEEVRREREEAGYPPFVRLVNVVVACEDASRARTASDEVYERLRSALPGATLLGPTDCPFERLHGKWRRHVLVKLPPGDSVESAGKALEGFAPKDVSLVVDVDPYSLM